MLFLLFYDETVLSWDFGCCTSSAVQNGRIGEGKIKEENKVHFLLVLQHWSIDFVSL